MEKMRCTVKFDGYTEKVKRKSSVEIELKTNEENKPVLSICGEMRGRSGQCLDEIAKYNKDPLFKTIYRLWKNYHLNNMHSGTEKQEKAVNKWLEETKQEYCYRKVCKYLQNINLYEDNGYKYGTGWIYKEIPEDDLNIIKTIINIYK